MDSYIWWITHYIIHFSVIMFTFQCIFATNIKINIPYIIITRYIDKIIFTFITFFRINFYTMYKFS